MQGGDSSSGTVILSVGAPFGGAVVSLSSSNPAVASVPASVTVPETGFTGTFAISTAAVQVTTSVVITASYNGSTRTGTLSVTSGAPPVTSLSNLAVSPSSVTGGSGAQGAVILTAAAPAGGTTVALSSSDPAASVPPSVTVAAGATSAVFAIATTSVTTSTTATIIGGARRHDPVGTADGDGRGATASAAIVRDHHADGFGPKRRHGDVEPGGPVGRDRQFRERLIRIWHPGHADGRQRTRRDLLRRLLVGRTEGEVVRVHGRQLGSGERERAVDDGRLQPRARARSARGLARRWNVCNRACKVVREARPDAWEGHDVSMQRSARSTRPCVRWRSSCEPRDEGTT